MKNLRTTKHNQLWTTIRTLLAMLMGFSLTSVQPANAMRPTNEEIPTWREKYRATKHGRLRWVDWEEVLLNDPAVQTRFTSDQWARDMFGSNLYVSVPKPKGSSAGEGGIPLAGIPVFGAIKYGDISGDGREEAVIPLDSGGTARTIGFLVYQLHPGNKLQLVDTIGGYHFGVYIEDGQLVSRFPVYGMCDWNGNFTSFLHKYVYLKQGQLIHVGYEWFVGRGENCVMRYYNALIEKKFEDAYSFLSWRYQTQNSYTRWIEQISKQTYVKYRIISPKNENAVPKNIVQAQVEIQQISNGISSTIHYLDTWHMVWDDKRKQWYLDTREQVEHNDPLLAKCNWHNGFVNCP